MAMTVYVVLFQEYFWYINTTGYSGAAVSSIGGMNGWDMVYHFFRHIGDNSTWGSTSTHFLMYSLVLFCAYIVFIVISMALTLILNFGILSRSRRLYRNAGWLFSAVILVYGIMIWHFIHIMNVADGTWSARVFNPWFYVPIAIAIASSIIGIVIRLTEVNR